jgi:hypothetical protein
MFSKWTFKTHCDQIWSCFSLVAGTWFIIQPIFPTFQLPSLFFCTTLHTWLGPPHPLIACILWCVCTHSIDLMGIHLLSCVHDNERSRIHDAIHDTFVAITWNDGFHLWWKQLHALPLTTFNSYCQWVDIVLIKDDICTLVDIIIIDPTWVDLHPWSYTIQRFNALDAVQAKKGSIATDTTLINSSF